jgi:hypothetical protein
MRELRAQDDAFELAFVVDVDGVFRRSRDLGLRLDARRGEMVAVELAGAGGCDRAENPVIGAAAAQMSRQRRADLLARRHGGSFGRAPAIVEGHGLDDKTRRAESALQGVVRHEGFLHRVQAGCADAFDRRHRLAGRGTCRHQAAHDGGAIHQHGAGTADAGATDLLGPGEIEVIPDDVDEKRFGMVGQGSDAAVDRHAAHLRSPGLRTDFFAGFGFAGRGAGTIAPATSVRTMVSRSARKLFRGCIAGFIDLAPLIAISTQRANSRGVIPSRIVRCCLRQILSIVDATRAE